MKISEAERRAIRQVLLYGAEFGYGNLISHLKTAWARTLMDGDGLSESVARACAGGEGYPFKMQEDLIERGEWDETGARYAKLKRKKTK